MTAKPWPKPNIDDCTQPPEIELTGQPQALPGAPDYTQPSWSQRGSATVDVQPTAGVMPGQNLKSWANWRLLLHSLAPVIVAAAAILHISTQDRVSVWIALAFAVIDPLFSFTNSTDTARRISYGIMGLMQTSGFVATLLVGREDWIPLVSTGVMFLNSTLATFYTAPTTLKPIV